MEAHLAASRAGAGGTPRARPAFRLGGAPAAARGALLAWLDAGLRGGRAGRLAAELPLALGEAAEDDHVVAWIAGAPASHALLRRIELEAAGVRLRLGMIGLVYTDPAWRGRGLAGACVEEALRRLAARGALLAALWSEAGSLYARHGFAPAGRETLWRLDTEICQRALAPLGGPSEVSPVRGDEWPALEALHAAKPSRVLRRGGELARAAGAPDCEVRVAREGGAPVAYAARGRGDDFRGVVHEWAGSARGVLSCLAHWLARGEELALLAGPAPEAPLAQLGAAGALPVPRPFAWLRLLGAEALWERLAGRSAALARLRLRPAAQGGFRFGDAERGAPLHAPEALALLFGPRPPAAALALLDGAERAALAERLPWPLFVWGFDSI